MESNVVRLYITHTGRHRPAAIYDNGQWTGDQEVINLVQGIVGASPTNADLVEAINFPHIYATSTPE